MATTPTVLYRQLSSGVSITATAQAGATALTVSTTAHVAKGQPVTGNGIPAGAYVASSGGNTIVISAPTTAALLNTPITVGLSGDPIRGQSQQNFLSDLDATAQAISTTIKLLQGEWFENLANGTPLFQSILGVANTNIGVSMILRARILSVPYVTAVQNLVINYNGATRGYSFSATVQTQFGAVTILNQPLPGIRASVSGFSGTFN
jgi:hypothetical protein